MSRNLRKKPFLSFPLLLSLSAVLVVGLLFSLDPGFRKNRNTETLMRAVEEEEDEKEQVRLMRELIYEIGPERAIDFLNNSERIPKSGQAHLLSHQIGEVAYKLYREEAFPYCRGDMLNGCTHGLVIAAVAEVGFEEVRRMVENCGIFSVFKHNMCLHAAGHGFAALENYDIYTALAHCDKLVERGSNSSIHCYNGVFMENVQGEHNDLLPEKHPYLSKKDLEMPCNSVDRIYREACYFAQPAWWRLVFNGDTKKTAAFCARIDKEYRDACADSLGRMIFTDFNYDLDKIVENCNFLPQRLSGPCLSSIAKFSFALGNREFPFAICQKIENIRDKTACYRDLVIHFREHRVSQEELSGLCSRIEAEYRYLCREV